MISPIQKTFEQAEKLLSIDEGTIWAFKKRLQKNNKYYKADGVEDHFCVGVVVICRKENKMFAGHHIKSDSWMGAGGHMDAGESPLQTALRECEEEIGLKTLNATLFDLTHFEGVNRQGCDQHYDFFYTIELNGTPNFKFDPKEFHEGGWYTYDEVLKKKLLPKYREALLKLFSS